MIMPGEIILDVISVFELPANRMQTSRPSMWLFFLHDI